MERVVAAVIFTHAGHELHLRHDWRDKKIGGTDFPTYKTFFILKRDKDDNSRDSQKSKSTTNARSNHMMGPTSSILRWRGEAGLGKYGRAQDVEMAQEVQGRERDCKW